MTGARLNPIVGGTPYYLTPVSAYLRKIERSKAKYGELALEHARVEAESSAVSIFEVLEKNRRFDLHFSQKVFTMTSLFNSYANHTDSDQVAMHNSCLRLADAGEIKLIQKNENCFIWDFKNV